MKQVKLKLNRESCEHYPCHFEGQDYRFCYYVVYSCECEDLRTKGKYKAQAFDACDAIIVEKYLERQR